MGKTKSAKLVKGNRNHHHHNHHHGSESPENQDRQQLTRMGFNREIFKIFSWLPAKSIFRFMSTSKDCKEFLSEMFFIKQQYRNMGSKGESAFFIQPYQYSKSRYFDRLEFHCVGEEASCGLPNRSLEFLRTTTRVLASSNGLLCCRNTKKDELLVCNPATQMCIPIELPENLRDLDRHFTFIFHCNIDKPSDQFLHNFELMIIEPTTQWSNNDATCKAYLPQTRIWQEIGKIDLGARYFDFQSAVYHNGKYHLISDWFPYISSDSPFCSPYILAYDSKMKAQKFLQIPKSARRGLNDRSCEMGIFEWGKGESICLVQLANEVFTVWILRDYNSSSWATILKIWTLDMGIVEPNDDTVLGFKVFNGEFLFVATKKKVYRYDLRGDYFLRRAEEICRHKCGVTGNVFFHSYSNTLRLCGDGAIPIPK